jgi:hypothetical protein
MAVPSVYRAPRVSNIFFTFDMFVFLCKIFITIFLCVILFNLHVVTFAHFVFPMINVHSVHGKVERICNNKMLVPNAEHIA